MSTNIKGLNNLVEAIDQKIKNVDTKHNELKIAGGDGILVTRLGNSFVINQIDKSSGTGQSYPWDINFTKVEGSDDPVEYTLSTNGGLINGYLPDNFTDFGTVEENDDEIQYVVAIAETDLSGILSLTIELKEEPPENQQFELDSIPTGFELLMAIIQGNKVYRQIYKRHLQAVPDVAYTLPNLDKFEQFDYYYCWSIREDN